MERSPGVIIKVRVILLFEQVLASTINPSPRLSKRLYDRVYFDCWDKFHQSIGSSDTWSDSSGQTS